MVAFRQFVDSYYTDSKQSVGNQIKRKKRENEGVSEEILTYLTRFPVITAAAFRNYIPIQRRTSLYIIVKYIPIE
ncbi:unnamed protein product [Acanthoscelides obtectus]|uniref:Uncharacterized protein n=1 Tax=Acanthoscelides obtectus TaxID=200917 RepID=A0A9P0PNF9_ACAOB|nr:unnamed protein product [Acanthoscelides obtectus]CAK1634059.1 hypothetical protein AOBTE_LOCUS8571 [Acanthoscelides obtectus]